MNLVEIVKQAIREKITILKKVGLILSKSKLTEKDSFEIGKKVNKAVARRFNKN